MTGWKLKAGAIILATYVFLAVASPLLVPKDDLSNWNYAAYWVKSPRLAPPSWINLFGKNLPPTGDLEEKESGVFVYNFHYDTPPEDILIVPPENWSGFVNVSVETPNGETLNVYSGIVVGVTSLARSLDVVSKIAEERGIQGEANVINLVMGGNGLKVLFGRPENGEWVPVHGVYTFRVKSTGKVKLRTVGQIYGLLGTDSYGRDLSVIFFGGLPETLMIVFMTAFATVFLGTLTGLFGSLSGKVGRLVEGIGKVSSMMPLVPAMILLVPILGGVSYYGAIGISMGPFVLALSLLLFGKVSQNVRTITTTELAKEHVLASKSLGGGEFWILRKHVLKAVMPYAVSQFILTSAKVIALISILGFFGVSFGFNWGELFTMVVTQKAIYNGAWWMILPVGIAISLIAIALLLINREVEERYLNLWNQR